MVQPLKYKLYYNPNYRNLSLEYDMCMVMNEYNIKDKNTFICLLLQ